MNNFADDEFDAEKEPQAEESLNQSPESTEVNEEINEDSFFRRKSVRVPLRILGGLFVILTSVSLYWARIPPTFDVTEAARLKAVEYGHREPDQPLPRGYRTVSSLIVMAEQLLEKPGG
ncbi:MAG: DUF2333 family protein, partial [Kiritimatiellia bacterium]